MSDWLIERITETPHGLRVDFHNERTMQRVSGFFTKWSEPPHLGKPFTHAAQAQWGAGQQDGVRAGGTP